MPIAMRIAAVIGLAAHFTGCAPRVTQVAVARSAPAFWCPMHPGIRGAAGERCSICDMSLVPVASSSGAAYALDVDVFPSATAPRAMRVQFHVRAEDGALVTDFDVVHDKLFHLFVVSRDLRYFRHLHPAQHDGSTFDVDLELPHQGHYQLIADFMPSRGAPQILQRTITTAGYSGPLYDVPSLTPDLSDKVVERTRVQLSMREAVAGGQRLMTFSLIDEPTGEPATGIEPYLGAAGHLVSVSADLTHAGHNHPLAQPGPASTVAFHVLFPTPGMYRVWVQFQRFGRVLTASFTVPVQERYRAGM